MTVTLGTRTCGVLGCHRERHISPAGIHYGRCLAHALAALHESFAAPATGPDRGVPPVLRSGPVAVSVPAARRPAA